MEEQRRARLRRTGVGAAVAVVSLAAATGALRPARGELSLSSVVLIYLIPVVFTAAAGGWWPASAAAVTADLLVNYFFIAPFHTLIIATGDDIVVLVVYLLVAVALSVAVDVAARHRATALRRDTEARLLADASSRPVVGNSLVRLLEQVQDSYRMTTVALAEGEVVHDRVGPVAAGSPVLSIAAGNGMRLDAWGPHLFAEDRRALARLAAAAARTVETQRLATEAARAADLARIDRLRAGLLDAVGHDLRTPLAGIKAAVSSLRQSDVDFTAADHAELLATVEESTDRLTGVVDNLLSLSRMRAGTLSVDVRPTAVDAVVAQALINTETCGTDVDLDVPDDLPWAMADPGLLERVIANLVTNARAAGPPGGPIRVQGRYESGRILLAVVDHGPGIPVADRESVFVPFQRLDDHTSSGLGLGLAIARGFTEAQGGSLTPTDTPNGGLTMTISIPVAT